MMTAHSCFSFWQSTSQSPFCTNISLIPHSTEMPCRSCCAIFNRLWECLSNAFGTRFGCLHNERVQVFVCVSEKRAQKRILAMCEWILCLFSGTIIYKEEMSAVPVCRPASNPVSVCIQLNTYERKKHPHKFAQAHLNLHDREKSAKFLRRFDSNEFDTRQSPTDV